MEKEEKLEWIRRGLESADHLAALVVEAPEGAMDFRPSDDAWTIREHLAHLADSEAVAIYFRARLALVQSGATAVLYDEEAWQRGLGYSGRDPSEALSTFLALREETLRVLRLSLDRDWDEAHFIHPEKGRVSLAQFVTLIAGHSDFHIPYIERNLQAFREE